MSIAVDGSNSSMSGECMLIIIKSLSRLLVIVLLQSVVVAFITLKPRSQSAVDAGIVRIKSTICKKFGHVIFELSV